MVFVCLLDRLRPCLGGEVEGLDACELGAREVAGLASTVSGSEVVELRFESGVSAESTECMVEPE
jgi:hypothetical protein